jgi:hypothetical protein
MHSYLWLKMVAPIVGLMLVIGCQSGSPPDFAEAVSSPLSTAKKLLELHELLGKNPTHRSEEAREREVDDAAMAQLFVDYKKFDPFLADLYVGFIVGALANNQKNMAVTQRRGGRATLSAGKLLVLFKLDGQDWKIILDRTVPDEIKKRAADEKRQFLEARARAESARAATSVKH